MKKLLILSFFVFIIPIGYIAMDYTREVLSADACLDSGGAFDYEKRRCDKESNHPYIAYSQRNHEKEFLCVGISFLGLTSFAWLKSKQQSAYYENQLNEQTHD